MAFLIKCSFARIKVNAVFCHKLYTHCLKQHPNETLEIFCLQQLQSFYDRIVMSLFSISLLFWSFLGKHLKHQQSL